MSNNRIQILILMLKMPQIGAVKSRLACDIGPLRAWQFYRNTVAGVTRRLSRSTSWHTHIFISPDRFTQKTRHWARSRRVFAQHKGDLGQRMLRGLRSGPAGAPIVLIGGDIPGIQSQHIHRALKALGHADVVFGPATDGGFWLVGWNGRRPLFRPFDGVRWSTAHALGDCLKQISQRRVVLVNELRDVDTGEDLKFV